MFYHFYFLWLIYLLSHSSFCSSTFSFFLRLSFCDFKNLLKQQGSNWGKHDWRENNFYYTLEFPRPHSVYSCLHNCEQHNVWILYEVADSSKNFSVFTENSSEHTSQFSSCSIPYWNMHLLKTRN